MGQYGYDRPEQTTPMQAGDAAPKTSGQRARQGQNIKGMLWVLGLGIGLVVIAYAVMLSLTAPTASEEQIAAERAAPVEVAPSETPPPLQVPQQ